MARALLWAALALAAAASVLLLRALGVPGAALLGPLVVGIAFALAGTDLKLKPGALWIVQAVLGSMVAAVLSPQLLRLLADHWVVILAVNAASILAATAVSLMLTRAGWLPGQTAIWGLSPGAASTMMLLGEERGEDPRVIATMQYLRIVIVALVAIGVAALLGGGAGSAGAAPSIFTSGAIALDALAILAALVVSGVLVARLLGWSQAAFWVPAIAGGALQLSQVARVEIPAALAAAAFATSGCYAGLRFNRSALASCARLLPAMLAGIALMVAACAALAWPMHRAFGDVNALTAFLATMPGGIDAAAAVAYGAHAALPVIVLVQVTRLVLVNLLAPQVARLAARSAK